jgi:valyl-tRNA synthetase
MVMMGLEFLGDVPFADVVINPIIQAPDGRRMSKSLGTGIDPLDLVDAHGADAVRFGLLLMASTQDVRFNEQRILQGRQLATKLWNATRLVVERGGRAGLSPPEPATLGDRWIADYLRATVDEANRLMAAYEFSTLADLIYRTIFDGFCDWYLELLKVGEGTPEVGGYVLEQLLALANPVMPFVTEECFATMPGAKGMLLTHPLPVAPWGRDEGARAAGNHVIDVVTALRAFKAENGMKPRDALDVSLDARDAFPLSRDPVARLAHVTWVESPSEDARSLPVAMGRLLVRRPDAQVDVASECRRISARLEDARSELARAEKQLRNERFVSGAPEHLVAAEREKAARFTDEIAKLTAERERLGCP